MSNVLDYVKIHQGNRDGMQSLHTTDGRGQPMYLLDKLPDIPRHTMAIPMKCDPAVFREETSEDRKLCST